ncbi:putative porin transmembrane protein [Alloalcanivorax dieselolei B5]|uniref:Putative porin transmembrane protein n=1 Tax=Alcanivorax dieselolei (strain DSM 16502 / CGMCC 1.3690 / MCCC 1A00001 / B-5) TaxID=930169 RepID=K0CDB3_ALCDB|nr:porin [Alloalcanivorax dieselolei]AFT69637.1 putative porin transmembrane protein [Alloalcanivorax dieselolei B5]GGK03523.1 porin [Alloalcanivorax dieselolei]
MNIHKRTETLILSSVMLGAMGFANAAQADELDADFYGLLDLWAGSIQKPADNGDTLQLAGGGMSTSFLGVRIDYPLNQKVAVFAQAEMFVRPDTGEDGRYKNDEFFGRRALIGASGDFGIIKAGRTKSPYFLSTVFTNPHKDSFAFSPIILHTYNAGNGGALMGDTTWNNSLNYKSPTLAGLSANVVYAFGEQEGKASENKVGGNIVYRNGPVLATVAAQRIREGALNSGGGAGERGALPDATDQDAWMAGLAYDFGVMTVFGQYQALSTDTLAGDVDVDSYAAGVAVPAGPGALLASYAHSDYRGVMDDERDTWSVGYDYIVNKQLDLYAMYLHDDQQRVGSGKTYGVGARFKF